MANGHREPEKTIDDEEEFEAETQEEASGKELRDPGCRTAEECERHCKTHVGKGCSRPTSSSTARSGSMRYLSLGLTTSQLVNLANTRPTTGLRFFSKIGTHRTIHGHIVSEKGVVSKLMEDIDELGYTGLALKGDGQPDLVQVMNEVKRQRQHRTILEHPPPYDPVPTGAVEKAVAHIMCQISQSYL